VVRRPVQAPRTVLEPLVGLAAAHTSGSVTPVAAVSATRVELLADLAVCALVDEAKLTPKPALVDRRGSGAHGDMDLGMLCRSAHALRPTFAALAARAHGRAPSQRLREELAAIGRRGEREMFAVTGGVNTHRGAIWTLGLLAAAAAMAPLDACPTRIAALAGQVAAFPDRYSPHETSHGARVTRRYGVVGARGEARRGFPHVVDVALPALRAARAAGLTEQSARLDALVALIVHVDDTCLLHRGGHAALQEAQTGARAVLAAGGSATAAGRRALRLLEAVLLHHNASPGGSADLLAGALLLDSLDNAAHGGEEVPEEVA
jgi:triphosphoribosyl-dephospho-CoA synthase